MTITPTTLTRAAGIAAAVAGLLFIGVQIGHPTLEVATVTTTDWAVRNTLKVVMAALALVGITGMYLSQVKKIGVLGLLGYVVFGVGYLVILSIAFIAVTVLPALADTAPAYVNDILAVASGRTASGDVGFMQTAELISGVAFVAGGFFFGVALFRAGVLARWAAALLALSTVATLAIPLLHVNERLFAIPTGVALIGLGYSLWRTQRTAAARTVPNPVSAQPDPAGAR